MKRPIENPAKYEKTNPPVTAANRVASARWYARLSNGTPVQEPATKMANESQAMIVNAIT